MKYTAEQYAAIHAENRELLVSASAGTGKTEVLTERITDMIVNRGFSIDRMAVVTFTKAAAQEMRSRIAAKLLAAAELDPRLRKQCDLVPLAQISTIDSLCQRIVRSHFEAVDMDPAYGVLTGVEWERLKKESMKEALDLLYEKAGTDEGMAALTAEFTDDEIGGMAEGLYSFLLARPDPLGTLREYAEKEYTEENLGEQPFAVYLKEEGIRIAEGALEIWNEAVGMLERGELDGRFAGNLDADYRTIQGLLEAGRGSFSQYVQGFANVSWVRKTAARANKDGLYPVGTEEFGALRKEYIEMIKAYSKRLPKNFRNVIHDMNHSQIAMKGLYRFMTIYTECFRRRKEKRHTADFSDIQLMALRILEDEKLRQDVASRYDAVFVDEYQDVSMVQEKLLRLLCREGGSAFYVGDVKQSIYRFRQAEPSLFIQKLSEYSTDPASEKRKIFLRDNFRSVSTIHHSVNRVFSHLMRSDVTEIDYDEDAMLCRPQESVGDLPFSIHVLPKGEREIVDQATWIVSDLLQRVGKPLGEGSEPLRFGDVLLLMPVGKGVLPKVEAVLRGLGIPVDVQGGGNAADSPEVLQVAAALECFTDCRNDESLLATLRSPILRFQERELCEVRLCLPQRGTGFYEALVCAAETAEEPLRAKCRAALEVMARERELMGFLPLDRYLWDFLRRSGYYLYVGQRPNGEQARANLVWLCECALEWEAGRDSGGAAFARYLREMGRQKDGATPTAVPLGENAVKLMTIHKSKGLGARLVYVMDMDHRIAPRAGSSALLYNNRLGIALEYRNMNARTRRKTLMQEAIKGLEDSAERAERVRLLYVAMTRAKEALVMVGADDVVFNPEGLEKYQKQHHAQGVRTASSYLHWLFQCAGQGDFVFVQKNCDKISQNCEIVTENITEQSSIEQKFPQVYGMISTSEGHDGTYPHVENWEIHSISTGFPQKTTHFHHIFHKNPTPYGEVWKTVFENPQGHMEKDVENSNVTKCNKSTFFDTITSSDEWYGFPAFQAGGARDCLLPEMPSFPALHKIGVTKLIASRREAANADFRSDARNTGEEPEEKRLPLEAVLPPPAPDMRLPVFLRNRVDTPVRQAAYAGTVTHLVLELLDLQAARNYEGNVDDFVRQELSRMVKRRVLKPEEASLVRPERIADFLCSPLGQRMLRSERVEREFGFTLRESAEDKTLVQGIIDLCFLEDGGWILVDFKTDHVQSIEELRRKYADQIAYYRQALTLGTPYPVHEALLYSVRLGQSVEV